MFFPFNYNKPTADHSFESKVVIEKAARTFEALTKYSMIKMSLPAS